ncbi:MAG: GNAT family N-acetyltransferase [Thermoleophilia bacterium]|nr:GNAT family N-acetyltransferase [Thermoleophilia bacterium]MDH5333165.1 GNAT family N-acetyltransferase [Thermoleophilia bacterium]
MTREERVMLDAYRGVSDVVEVPGAVVLLVPEAPGSPMLNRVVGLGSSGPATEEQLDAALSVVPSGTRFYVAVAPDAEPSELAPWLSARGLEPGWGWMAFRRGVEAAPAVETVLELVDVESPRQRAAFARIVRQGYDLPEEVERRLAGTPDTAGWGCLLAVDGGEPAGAAALFVADGVGYLGFAATLPAHRGKGAQSALLAERIRRAATARCDLVITETGERRDDLPSNSYRNILRAGFEEVGVTANWVGTAA